MNRLVLVGLLALSFSACAEEVKPAGKGSVYNKLGGFVEQPGSRKGSIGFLNAQQRIAASEIEKVKANMNRMLKHDMLVKAVEAPKGLPMRADVEKAGVTIGIFAVDDPSLPALLAAPEERWALVNVAKIGADLGNDAVAKGLIKGRFRGELQRAFILACGGWSSQYAGNVAAITDQKAIDAVDPDGIVGDLMPRYESYLKTMGIVPARVVPYTRACHEGWAAAPTNDFQKAIWDKIHTIPTKPLTIEPEKAPIKK